VTPTDTPGRRGQSVLVSAALGAALSPLNSTMVAVALPALSHDFGAAPSTVTLTVITGYLVATLVSQMPAGTVADRIGYGRALAWGQWLFFAGSVAATVAPHLGVC
jgi:MFS family permease